MNCSDEKRGFLWVRLVSDLGLDDLGSDRGSDQFSGGFCLFNVFFLTNWVLVLNNLDCDLFYDRFMT